MTERYLRQVAFAPIGMAGQQRLQAAHAVVVGVGALGTLIADRLVRAGVGRVTLIDRDVVELDNLHRQALFTQADVMDRLPKAEAAARRLREINSEVCLVPRVVDVTPANVEMLLHDAAVVLDGTDNFETRFLLNDVCVKHAVPWVYGGVLGATGMWMVIRPTVGPCLRCLLPVVPAPGTLPTCETDGVVNTIPALIAAFQVTEALKCLIDPAAVDARLHHFDLWHNVHQPIDVLPDPHCRTCATHEYPHLVGGQTTLFTRLCGRKTVQVNPVEATDSHSLADLRERLARIAPVFDNGLLLQFEVDGFQFTVFAGGRALIRGTDDETLARSLYSRFIGM